MDAELNSWIRNNKGKLRRLKSDERPVRIVLPRKRKPVLTLTSQFFVESYRVNEWVRFTALPCNSVKDALRTALDIQVSRFRIIKVTVKETVV